uniref:Uncharacterized protein n=1 Tax=Anguilla anguilla TaxID=7936 RepID=A0A0E9TVW1_ANGAN
MECYSDHCSTLAVALHWSLL